MGSSSFLLFFPVKSATVAARFLIGVFWSNTLCKRLLGDLTDVVLLNWFEAPSLELSAETLAISWDSGEHMKL